MSSAPSGALRAADSDRADVCGMLDAALADGQLTAAEYATRTSAAMRAVTFADLETLIADLQLPEALVDTPVVRADLRRPHRLRMPLAIVAGAAALGAVVGLAVGCAGGGAETAAEAGRPAFTTPNGLARFIADYRAHFGDTSVDEVTLHPEHVSIVRRAADNPAQEDRWDYDGEFDHSVTTSRDPDDPTIDLAALDLPAIAAVLAGSTRTVGVPEGAVTHLGIEPSEHAGIAGGLEVQIFVADERGGRGDLTVAADGAPVAVFPAGR